MKKENILIACEESGIVRDAFIKLGHNAISCDILPTAKPGPHIQGYLEDAIGSGKEWDKIIAFPPCTFLCCSGLHRNKNNKERQQATEYALAFVCMILNRDCKQIALENPIGCISTRIELINGVYTVNEKSNSKKAIKPAQIIQPWQFGHDASKGTCLYLKGLPLLQPTKIISPRIVNGKKRWANQLDSGQNRLSPSPERSKIRSRTYEGIAEAMANQWK